MRKILPALAAAAFLSCTTSLNTEIPEYEDSQFIEFISLPTWENYQTRKFPETYIAKYIKDGSELYFAAVQHAGNFDSLTYKTVKHLFDTFVPDLVIVEYGTSSFGISPSVLKDKLRNQGNVTREPEYAICLAINNKKKIDFFAAEPETGYILDRIGNYTVQNRPIDDKDVLFFYTLRGLEGYIQRNSIITTGELKKAFPGYLEERIKDNGFGKSLSGLNFEDFQDWYKKLSGESYDIGNPVNFSPVNDDNISMINKYVSYLRDINVINNLDILRKSYKKILIVYGMGHYTRLKPALEKMFSPVKEEYQIDPEPETDFFEFFRNREKEHYNVRSFEQGGYISLIYGNTADLESLPELKNYLATGWSHLVYYKNTTDKHDLYSVNILGRFYGGQNNKFNIKVLDLQGNELYCSPDYNYSDFPKDRFGYREYIVELNDIPHEFFVQVDTNSNGTNGVYIMNVPASAESIYSFEFYGKEKYNIYKNGNAVIYLKFA